MTLTPLIQDLIERSLVEDLGPGDCTTRAILSGEERGCARALAKSPLVLAGIEVFAATFRRIDGDVHINIAHRDGEALAAGVVVAELEGRLASLLTAERVALNFLQRMSGIATLTRRYVEAVAGTGVRILDTRKTVPGLRILDKYAVRTGGGANHRLGLFDAVLVKDNHIAAAGGIATALRRVRERVSHLLKVEVEAGTLADVALALQAGADIIMLDNMSLADMATAVHQVAGKVPLEASGNMTLETVRRVAETGVDYISVGALTHSVMAADISLEVF